MLLAPFTYHAPASISDAAKLYADLEGARLQAGGTFLLNSLKTLKRKGLKTPEHIISLKKIAELKGIREEKDKLIIHAMATMSDLLNAPLKENLNVLQTIARHIGTTQVRNMATVGGNLTCRYTWTEMPAAAVGLQANLHFINPDGKEKTVSAEDFFQSGAKTQGLLTQISIKKDPKSVVVYERVRRSADLDIPLFSLLIRTRIDKKTLSNTRVTVNNGVTFARRDQKLEKFLDQTGLTKTLAEEAVDHLDEPLYDTRSSDYKKHMFRVAIRKAITRIVENEL